MLIVCLYVEDLIFCENASIMFEEFKKSMMVEFEMSDLGMMYYFLGIEVVQTVSEIFICQKMCVKFRHVSHERSLKLNKELEGKKVVQILYKQIVAF